MKDLLHELLTGLSRWPLLLGAVTCYSLAIYEEIVTDTSEIAIAVTGVVVGSVLLGAWLVSYVVAGERKAHREHRACDDDPPTRR